MTVERAEGLLESMLYTVSESGASHEELLSGDMNEILASGQKLLSARKRNAEDSLRSMSLPENRNVFYDDTLRNLGLFFTRYDVYYSAHEIPCGIDYPLLHHVPEKMKGLSFVEEYIGRIRTENGFLNCFDPKTAERLYSRTFRNYRSEYFNLCEPILTNVAGLSLLKRNTDTFTVGGSDRNEIIALLRGKSYDEVGFIVENAIKPTLCKYKIKDTDYFATAAAQIAPRLCEAVGHGDVSNVFAEI